MSGRGAPGVPHHTRAGLRLARVFRRCGGCLCVDHALQSDIECQAVTELVSGGASSEFYRNLLRRRSGHPRRGARLRRRIRRGAPPPPPRGAAPGERAIRAGARAGVAEFGVRRTTLPAVARRAGVSRPTVYRRWPDTGSLVADLLVRELREIITGTAPSTGSARERLVGGIVGGGAAMRRNPLFAKIFRADTDIMLTYVFERLGRNQRALLDLFAAAILEGQDDGSIRDGNPAHLSAMLLLIAQSSVQSASTFEPVIDAPHLDTELARALHGYLTPT
nr:TetR/AcrR family transcriptional regulator [Nocardia seriolae]